MFENKCNKIYWNKDGCQTNLVTFIMLILSLHMDLRRAYLFCYIWNFYFCVQLCEFKEVCKRLLLKKKTISNNLITFDVHLFGTLIFFPTKFEVSMFWEHNNNALRCSVRWVYNEKSTHQSFRSVSPEEGFAWFTGDCIEIVAKCAVPTNTTYLVFLVLTGAPRTTGAWTERS